MEHGYPVEPTTVVGDEEEHHEKKSMLTKVQDKVKKLKNTINKKRHTHPEVPVEAESEEYDDEHADMEVEPDLDSSPRDPMYEPTAAPHLQQEPPVTPDIIKSGRQESPVIPETIKAHTEEFADSNEDMDVDPEVNSTPVYDSPAAPRDFDGRHESPVTPEPVESDVLGGQHEPLDGRHESPVTPEPVEPLGGRHESSVTPESVEPHVLHGQYEPLDGRHDSSVTPEPVDPYVLNSRHEPLDGRHESPVTPEPVEPHVLDGRYEPLDGQHESPVTPESFEPHVFNGRHKPHDGESPVTPESVEPHVLDGRHKPSVTPETINQHVLDGQYEPPVTPETIKATTEGESVAPLPYGSVPSTTVTDGDTNLPTSVVSTPGNESSVPPEVLSSLQAMTISEQGGGQQRDQPPSQTQPGSDGSDETPISRMSSDTENKPSYTEKLSTTAATAEEAAVSSASGPTGTPAGGVEEERKPSYTEKVSSTAFAAKDAAVSAASMVYAKVAGKEEGTYSSVTRDQVVTPVSTVASTEEGAGEKKGGYTEKLSGTALAAKDAAVTAASTVYGKMVWAGAAVMGNVEETEQDKVVVEKGRIELPEVTSRVVVSDAPAEALSDAPAAVDVKSGGYTGQGMVDKIRGAVTSLVGGRGRVVDAPAAAVEAPSDGTADAPAAAVATSSGGGRGGVADTPAAVVEAVSG